MKKPTTRPNQQAEIWDDPLVGEIRPVVREAIERILDEELKRALGAAWYTRAEQRAGYRNGSLTRSLGTPMGPMEIKVPRGRLIDRERVETEVAQREAPASRAPDAWDRPGGPVDLPVGDQPASRGGSPETLAEGPACVEVRGVAGRVGQ